MEFRPTTYVILGILGLGPHSGYDIKQLADLSTRHFWATSYGQIYPELKRLTEAGLIKPKDASRGDRQRTLYSITDKGHETLRTWVANPAIQTLEGRDQMLLKLFFPDEMSAKETLRHLDAMVRRHKEVVAGQLEGGGFAEGPPPRKNAQGAAVRVRFPQGGGE